MMRPQRVDRPRDLFESSEAPTQLCDQHKQRVMQLVQVMLLEIMLLKGTMSELELSILRQRSLEALKQKARRGELCLTVAIGDVKERHNRIVMDPNRRVREGIALVFLKFAEFRAPVRSICG